MPNLSGPVRNVPSPRLIAATAIVVVLLGSALFLAAPWSSNSASDADEPAEAATPAETPTPTPTSTPTPEPTPTATPTPENRLAIIYVANTGGDGVSLRDSCREDARVPGAWAEGTAVRLIDVGSDACEGWTYVAGPGEGSWVNDGYLSEDRPAVAPPSGGGGGGGGSTPSPGSAPPSGAPMFVFGTTAPGAFVLVFAGNQFCDSTIAASGIGSWGLEIGAGTECHPASGAPLIFSVNGQVVHASALHTYKPGASEAVELLVP